MTTFKIDMHVHTMNVSECGHVSAREVVQLYKNAGYDGIIITDHYYDGYFYWTKKLPWPEQIRQYLSGFREAVEFGKKVGLHVFLGLELRFANSENDYLVYGVDDQFLIENSQLYNLNLAEFYRLKTRYNLLIYQAHPFRPGMSVNNPMYLDGVEVYNGNPRHESRNQLAYEYARQHHLKMISGSDFHRATDVGRGGIIIKQSVATNLELVKVLKEDREITLIGLEGIAS